MTEELTERQKGIADLRDLLFSYNVMFVGDEGWRKAYRDFMEKEGIALKTPTRKQDEYAKQLGRLGD
jgi:hypothetical protein